MSTPARRLDLIALDDATEDARLEYVVGHVFALAGASRRHIAITANLTALLAQDVRLAAGPPARPRLRPHGRLDRFRGRL